MCPRRSSVLHKTRPRTDARPDVIITKRPSAQFMRVLAPCNLPRFSVAGARQEEGTLIFPVVNTSLQASLSQLTLIDALRRLIRPGSVELRRQSTKRISRPRARLMTLLNAF